MALSENWIATDAEIFSAAKTVIERFDLLLCIRVVRRLVALQIRGLLHGYGAGHDLRKVILRLDEVELSLVGQVITADVRVGDVDFRFDLFVEQLFLGQRSKQVAFQIIERDVALFKLLVKLLLRVGRLHFGQLGIHIFIGSCEIQLGGALLKDFVFDQLVKDIQPYDAGLLAARILGILTQAGFVVFLDIGAHDVFAIYGGHDVGRGRLVATGQRGQEEAAGENWKSRRWAEGIEFRLAT